MAGSHGHAQHRAPSAAPLVECGRQSQGPNRQQDIDDVQPQAEDRRQSRKRLRRPQESPPPHLFVRFSFIVCFCVLPVGCVDELILGFIVHLQVDVASAQYPYYSERHVHYPYAPPYGFYPPHTPLGYAPSPPLVPPYRNDKYAAAYHVKTTRRRRPRPRSPPTDSADSSRSMDEAAQKNTGRMPQATADAPERAQNPLPSHCGMPATTAVNAEEPRVQHDPTNNNAQSEEENQPLSEMFRVAPSRVAPPQKLQVHTGQLLFFPSILSSAASFLNMH